MAMKREMVRALLVLASGAIISTCSVRVLHRGEVAEEGLYFGKMSNGLSVLIKEDHSAAVAAINIYVKAGSRNEPPEWGGISHLIEHMIFKGTDRRPVGQVAREIEERGGELNAYTSNDETVYWAIVPSAEVATGLDVLLDGVFHPKFDPTELEKEREVVLEELRRSLDSPERRLYDVLSRSAYEKHPYARPVLGTELTLRAITRGNVADYHQRWYSASNMIAVVVGDVRIPDIRGRIETFVKGVKKRAPAQALVELDASDRPGKVSVVLDKTETCQVAIAFPIVNAVHEDAQALDVLASVLGGGESALLTRRLKYRDALVPGIYAYADTPADPGLFVIGAEADPDKLGDATKVILDIVNQVKKSVDPKDVARGKFTLERSIIERRETMQGKARAMATAAALYNDPRYEDRYLDSLKGISEQRVKEAARKYLQIPRATVAVVYPESAGKSREAVEEMLRHVVQLSGLEATALRKLTLKNGIRLILWETTSAPTVAMTGIFRGGVRAESSSTNGVSSLLSETWTRGTGKRDGDAMAQRLEEIGSSIEGFSGMNSFGLKAQALSTGFRETADLYWETLFEADFPDEEVKKAVDRQISMLQSNQRDLARLTFQRFRENLFPDHPYRLDSMGRPESVKKLTRSDLLSYYDRWATPPNLVLSVVGDFDSDHFLKTVKPRLEAWKTSAPGRLAVPGAPGTAAQGAAPKEVTLPAAAPPTPAAVTDKTYSLESNQTHLIVGYPGPAVNSPDRAVLDVLDAGLSNQSGRLFINLRDKEALAYTVYFQVFYGIDTGYVALYLACDPAKSAQAKQGMLREMQVLLDKGITAEELNAARRYLVGSYQIHLQKNMDKSFTTAIDEALGLGYDRFRNYETEINKVTMKEVERIIRKYIQPTHHVLISLGGGA
ncbi:MAG: insulinase family protein [Nitrospirae bacterium]|nr:insulinase family protein [Nitrospirota bacterium]